MYLSISKTSEEMGAIAAQKVKELIDKAVAEKGEARMMVSTGQSQFEFFETLVTLDIPWDKVEIFHLDEYVDLPITHIASFRKYLKERFIDKVGSKRMNYITGEGDTAKTIAEITAAIREKPIDIGVIGIGENGHIAFNDPWVADFNDPAIIKAVTLDERCRTQQVNDGCFEKLEEVPTQALTVTIPGLCRAKYMFCSVPAATKAEAIGNMLNGEVTVDCPASILTTHEDAYLYTDRDAAARIL